MNANYSRCFIVGGKISEVQMVKGIIDMLDANCSDQLESNIPTLRNYLYRNADMLKFDEALRELDNYTACYHNNIIPEKLDCIDRVGIYVIANRSDHDD